MSNKPILKSRLTPADVDLIKQIRSDLILFRPVWSLMSRLFNNFNVEEWDATLRDISFFINYLEQHGSEVNVTFIESLAKSFGLMSERFCPEMLETYGRTYQFLIDSGLTLQSMYEGIYDAFRGVQE